MVTATKTKFASRSEARMELAKLLANQFGPKPEDNVEQKIEEVEAAIIREFKDAKKIQSEALNMALGAS